MVEYLVINQAVKENILYFFPPLRLRNFSSQKLY